jgi:predicted transcriptional regulator
MSETILGLTARIVSVFVGNNAVRAVQVPTLITEVHRTLATVGETPRGSAKAEPAVEARKSVFADHLVCLGCGGSFKTLKWHIMSEHELTPEQYRSKFGLPRDQDGRSRTLANTEEGSAQAGLTQHPRSARSGNRVRTSTTRGQRRKVAQPQLDHRHRQAPDDNQADQCDTRPRPRSLGWIGRLNAPLPHP